jgi:hypothetical protein
MPLRSPNAWESACEIGEELLTGAMLLI